MISEPHTHSSPSLPAPAYPLPVPLAEELHLLARILEVVRERTGLDFSGYRMATMLRRVRNRMISARLRTLADYLERLQAVPGEEGALVERLTIKVSRFFRDPPTFAALSWAVAERREVLAGSRALRVWSAGCGCGEEPYSVATLLGDQGLPASTGKVLATDIDPAALAFARRGRYPGASLQGFPSDLRSRFLVEQHGPKGPSYEVGPGLRARVDFRLHDLTGDAPLPEGRPFDLICCRNVLIYLQPHGWRQVFGVRRPGALSSVAPS